jgi:hypothetical protein
MDRRITESLIELLKDNIDVFAWTHEDMPGIDPSVISHKLNVDLSMRPIKQKRLVFAPERNQAISGEVEKLLTRRVHQRSLLPRLVSQRNNGEEVQRQVENVRGFHGPEQNLPKSTVSPCPESTNW